MNIDDDGKLLMRTKGQILLQGPYGTIFAKSTYYYGGQYANQPFDFYVEAWSNLGAYEPAEEVGEVDDVGERTAISIIRIFKAPPGYLVACATYDLSGTLVNVSVNGAKDGDWVHSNEVHELYPELQVATSHEDIPETRTFLGLPGKFPIADYLKHAHDVSEATGLESFSDIVSLHYQRNRYVRQDIFTASGTHTTHLLAFKMTPEDQQLQSVDAAMKIRR